MPSTVIGMRVKNHKDLDFYNRAYALSLQIHKSSYQLPKIEQWSLADQMRRASRSICANIAEGYIRGRASGVEFKRFLNMALSSCEEMQVWLDYCLDLGYWDQPNVDKYRQEYTEIAKMLFAFQRRVE